MSRIASVVAASMALFGGSAVSAQVTQRLSVDSFGAQGNDQSGLTARPSLSADGRYIAFQSAASNLVLADTNGALDVFVRDRQTGTTECVSIDPAGVPAIGTSTAPSISADGRYVAFQSSASTLVPGDTNNVGDIFVRDRVAGTTERVSLASNGAQGNLSSAAPVISADGRFVAFQSDASNLIAADTNGRTDVFVRDRLTGMTELVSQSTSGAQGNSGSDEPSISADGRFVSFDSAATNLVSGSLNLPEDVFVRDRLAGTTQQVSVATGGAHGNDVSGQSSISADGRYVAFYSIATNLVAGDNNGTGDVFVRDLVAGTTECASIDGVGAQANLGSIFSSLSGDGRYVAFMSFATNLVSNDTNGVSDIFVHDRVSGSTERVSISTAGAQGDQSSTDDAISADGRFVAMSSNATNLVGGDTNAVADVFVHDRFAAGFTSVCDAGIAGVIACPCSNPPVGPGRGCDNSASTGGAILSASGAAYVSMDTLVFTTNAEKPTATSIVMQGNALAPNGLVFGQGIRCAAGTLKRLYTKTAVGGSITAPNFGAGDPTVSARSTTLGDTLQAGQSRWYFVYYRDPIVLGGCPAGSTFNATQTGQVMWSL